MKALYAKLLGAKILGSPTIVSNHIEHCLLLKFRINLLNVGYTLIKQPHDIAAVLAFSPGSLASEILGLRETIFLQHVVNLWRG